MKKILLLLSVLFFINNTNAQLANPGIVFSTAQIAVPNIQHSPAILENTQGNTALPENRPHFAGARTTSSMIRWYDYVGSHYYLNNLLQRYELSLGHDVNYNSYDMWNDTTALFGETGTTPVYRHNGLISLGLGFDPMYYSWDTFLSSSLPGVSPLDAYTIDSVQVPGWYTHLFNTPAKLSVVDTLIFSFVQIPVGSGMASTSVYSSYYGVSSINYMDLYRDTVNNVAAGFGSFAAPTVYKFLLSIVDSNTDCYKNPNFPRPGHAPADPVIAYSVTPGNVVAMTVTYKSGDTSYHPTGGGPGDTVRYSNGTSVTGYKYDTWKAQVCAAVIATGSQTAIWPPYDPTNLTSGYFEFAGNGWGAPINKYYPNWVVTSDTPSIPSPSNAQYPHISYHITCPTCTIIGPPIYLGVADNIISTKITASPNPANDELNISFTLSQNTNISVTLTNMLGQVVASQKINNANNGKATFNTSSLPDGIYIYTFEASGERKTGRIVVAH